MTIDNTTEEVVEEVIETSEADPQIEETVENLENTAEVATEAQVDEFKYPTSWGDENIEYFKGIEDLERRSALRDKFKNMMDGGLKKMDEVASERKQFETEREAFKENERFFNGYKDFESSIAQEHRSLIMQSHGGMPQYMATLYNMDREASQDPLGFIQRFMQSNGIDYETLQSGVASPEYQQRIQQQQSQQQFGQIKEQTVAEVQKMLEERELKGQVDGFINAKDESGSPKHPHFEVVRPMMAALAQTQPNATIEELYDQACYANPQIRSQIAQSKADAEVKVKTQQDDVAKAKAASGVSSTASPKVKQTNNWRQALDGLIQDDE